MLEVLGVWSSVLCMNTNKTQTQKSLREEHFWNSFYFSLHCISEDPCSKNVVSFKSAYYWTSFWHQGPLQHCKSCSCILLYVPKCQETQMEVKFHRRGKVFWHSPQKAVLAGKYPALSKKKEVSTISIKGWKVLSEDLEFVNTLVFNTS